MSETQVSYRGRPLSLFRLIWAGDKTVYGSSSIPIHVVRYETGSRAATDLGVVGDGEIYSLLFHNSHLLMALYAGKATLLDLDPELLCFLVQMAPFQAESFSGISNVVVVAFQFSHDRFAFESLDTIRQRPKTRIF